MDDDEDGPPPFSKDGAHPEIHALLWDKRRRVVGTVETIGYRITLRPEGGGREWDPEWADVRPATEAHRRASRMRTGVATANRRSRGEVL